MCVTPHSAQNATILGNLQDSSSWRRILSQYFKVKALAQGTRPQATEFKLCLYPNVHEHYPKLQFCATSYRRNPRPSTLNPFCLKCSTPRHRIPRSTSQAHPLRCHAIVPESFWGPVIWVLLLLVLTTLRAYATAAAHGMATAACAVPPCWAKLMASCLMLAFPNSQGLNIDPRCLGSCYKDSLNLQNQVEPAMLGGLRETILNQGPGDVGR